MKIMPDKRPRPTVMTEEQLATLCAKSRTVRETMYLQKENERLRKKRDAEEAVSADTGMAMRGELLK